MSKKISSFIKSDNIININNVIINENDCVICKKTLCEETYYPLPECGHIFHTECIMTWFRNGNHECPICKCYDKTYLMYSNKYNSDDDYFSKLNKGTHILKIPNNLLPEYLIHKKNKYKELINKNKELKNEINNLKKKPLEWFIENKNIHIYSDITKYISNIISIVRKNNSKIRKIIMFACELSIIPLIIPRYRIVDVNITKSVNNDIHDNIMDENIMDENIMDEKNQDMIDSHDNSDDNIDDEIIKSIINETNNKIIKSKSTDYEKYTDNEKYINNENLYSDYDSSADEISIDEDEISLWDV